MKRLLISIGSFGRARRLRRLARRWVGRWRIVETLRSLKAKPLWVFLQQLKGVRNTDKVLALAIVGGEGHGYDGKKRIGR